MKSKRRHELQTNELADQLGQWIEAVRPYTTLTIAIVAGVVLIIAGWYYLTSSREKKKAESWRSYMLAGTNTASGDAAEDLSLVADQFSDTQAGQWAALTAADLKAEQGVRLMFTDRAAAETALNEAKSHYRQVLDSKYASQDDMLSNRAHYGLAQVCEAQSELDEAKNQYTQVVERSPGSALATSAQKRIDMLQQASTKKWYNWFANQKPEPRKLGTGAGLPGLGGPPVTDLNTLPDGPTGDFMKGAESPAGAGTDIPLVTPAESPTGLPPAPAKETPSVPAKETPAEPTKEAPAPPAPTAPATEPAKETPAEPAKDAPADQQQPSK